MPLPEFNYKTARQSDSVVVLAAGPSLLDCVEETKAYVKANNSIVIGTNYDYPIKSDYAFYGDPDRFENSMRTIKANEILTAYDLKGRFKKRFSKKLWLQLTRGKKIYRWGNNISPKKWRYKSKQKLVVNPDGSLQFRPGTSAFAAMIVACTCRPKKILIVGLDGPKNPTDAKGKRFKKYNFDGKARTYRSWKQYKMKVGLIKNKVLRFLKERGDIQLETFSNCEFWGLDKESLGVRVINV